MFTNEFYTQLAVAAAKEVIKEVVKGGYNFIQSIFQNKKEESPVIDDALLNPETDIEDVNLIDWGKIKTIYWLGNDLMWINDMIYRGASPERVLQGINHTQHYVERLGFNEKSYPILMLNYSRDALSAVIGFSEKGDMENRKIQEIYSMVAHYIEQIKFFLDASMNDFEPDFVKMRA